jgi:NADH-quinone oxidoreductase subunit L
MTVPLMVLAVGAAAAGFVVGPLTEKFAHVIALTPGLPAFEEHADVMVMVVSSAIGLAGIALAWVMYIQQPGLADRMVRGAQNLYQLSLNKLYIDEIYYALVVGPATALAIVCRFFDLYILDGLVDLIGQVPRLIGQLFRPIQNGLVQFYALAMVLGMTVFLIALMRALGG